jgi:hypothetical protein
MTGGAAAPVNQGAAPLILVDAHVHLHPCFPPAAFLDAAAANIAAAGAALGLETAPPGRLMLAEVAGMDAFGALAAGRLACGAWRITPSVEPVTLHAACPSRPPLILVAGRQIVRRERLEILALGLALGPPDGRPAREVLAALAATDALVVLPWGLGKWTGRRQALVRDLLQRPPVAPLFAGDNAGRPAGLPRPRLLALAERHGCPVLPGSDPLPLAAEIDKPGRYGFVAALPLDPERPFAALKRWLEGQRASPAPYGRLERLAVVVHRQAALRWSRRTGH